MPQAQAEHNLSSVLDTGTEEERSQRSALWGPAACGEPLWSPGQPIWVCMLAAALGRPGHAASLSVSSNPDVL